MKSYSGLNYVFESNMGRERKLCPVKNPETDYQNYMIVIT